jgi:hypothetical protein
MDQLGVRVVCYLLQTAVHGCASEPCRDPFVGTRGFDAKNADMTEDTTRCVLLKLNKKVSGLKKR